MCGGGSQISIPKASFAHAQFVAPRNPRARAQYSLVDEAARPRIRWAMNFRSLLAGAFTLAQLVRYVVSFARIVAALRRSVMAFRQSAKWRGPVRPARRADAPAMGRLYVAAWREAYPSLLPTATLLSMSEARAARQFEAVITRGRDTVLVAEIQPHGVAGLATAGPASDRGLKVGTDPAQGEIFTLYVEPLATDRGIGSWLLTAILQSLAERGHRNVVVWVLKGNPARFFYEHMGAKLVATKRERRFGTLIDLEAYAWPDISRVMLRRSASQRRLNPPAGHD
jgi:GNAT superfamily N-acetyltransferase